MKIFLKALSMSLLLILLNSCQSIVYEYNAKKLPVKRTDELGVCLYSYDDSEQLTSITLHDGCEWKFSYTTKGDVSRILDPSGGVTTYEYDKNGKPIKMIFPDGTSINNPKMPENPKTLIFKETETFRKAPIPIETETIFSKKSVFKYDDRGRFIK